VLQLIVTRDDEQILTRVLTPGEYMVGRLEDNDVVLDDRQVSRRHARINVGENSVKLEDLGSSNKILMDGQELDQVELHPGQSAVIRPFTLTIETLPETDDRTVVLGGDIRDVHDQATKIMSTPISLPRIKLVVRQGKEAGRAYPLPPGTTLIGRAEESDIRLQDPSVSRRHAEINYGLDGLVIKDLGSSSGTFVQTIQIQEQLITPGDTIRLGNVTIELLSDSAVIEKNIPPHKKGGSPLSVAHFRPRSGKFIRIALLVLAVSLSGLGAYYFFFGPAKQPANQVVLKAGEQTRTMEMDQIQRLVTINLVKGKQALEASRFEEAADFLHKVVVADPNHQEARQLLLNAQQAIDQHRAEQQRKEQERLVLEQKINKLLVDARQALDRNDFPRAASLAKQILGHNRDHGEAGEIVKKAEVGQREAQRRQQRSQEAMRKLEADAQSAFERGQSLRQQGSFVQAVRTWEQVLQIDPRAQTKYPAQAETLIEQVKQELRDRAKPLVESASTQARDDPRKAMRDAQFVLEIDPWNVQAADLLERLSPKLLAEGKKFFDEGLVLESLGELSQACEKWRLALEWVPASNDLHQRIKSKEAQCR